MGPKCRLIRTIPSGKVLLVAALNGNAVAESRASGILVGADLEVHLADALAWRWREGTKLCASAGWRFHPLVHNLHGPSTGKLQKSLAEEETAAGNNLFLIVPRQAASTRYQHVEM